MKTASNLDSFVRSEPLVRVPDQDIDHNLNFDLDLDLTHQTLSTLGQDKMPAPSPLLIKALPIEGQTETPVEHDEGELRRIDPNRIRKMQLPNRHESAFDTDDFDSLCHSIVAASGNRVPISVVQLDSATAEHDYELVAGERRMRACLESNLPVWAIVRQSNHFPVNQRLLETLSENLGRQNLSAYEFGRQFKQAMDDGRFSSARAFARSIGKNPADVNVALKLASLPAEVVAAFASTADLQVRFEKPLSHAVAKNLHAVLEAAVAIQAMKDRPAAKDVLSLLVAAASAPPKAVLPGGVGPSDTPSKGVVWNGEKAVGKVQFDRRGHAKISLDWPLTGTQQVALQKQVDSFMQRCLQRAAAGGANTDGARTTTVRGPKSAKVANSKPGPVGTTPAYPGNAR